jgi:hypothetical protein
MDSVNIIVFILCLNSTAQLHFIFQVFVNKNLSHFNYNETPPTHNNRSRGAGGVRAAINALLQTILAQL